MSDERLRLVAELQNKASAELRRLTKDLGAVKPNTGMIAATRWMTDFRTAGQKAAEITRPLPGMLSAIGVGGIAAGLSLGEMVKQFRDLASELPRLKELGRESGMSETELKRLAYAARILNADGDKMGAAVGTWSGKMVEFRKHTGTLYTEMLRQNSDLAKKIQAESPADGFKDMLGWIARIPDAARKAGYSAADAVQIQKRWLEEATGSDDLMPMLAKGAQGLADAYGEAARNVAPITPELERQAEALNQALARFDQTWANFKTEVGPTVLNGLAETVDKLDRVFKLIQAHPTEAAIGAGGAAALFARNRIMARSSTFGLRDAATRHMEAAAALKGSAASLAEAAKSSGVKGGGGVPPSGEGKNPEGKVPSLGARIVGFAFGLGGIVANAPSADTSGDAERQANHDVIESVGQSIENALHLPQLRDYLQGRAKLPGEDDRETRARSADRESSVRSFDGNALRRNDEMPIADFAAKKDTADAVKTGTLAAWREMAQQEGSGGSFGGAAPGHGGSAGMPNLRYGRGANGAFRHGPGAQEGDPNGAFNPRAPTTPGTFRPQYKLSDADLDDRVVNTIAGEAVTSNPESIDAVVNNMLNRVGSKGWGASGSLLEVARATGQYAGYRKASAAEAEHIRDRIRAIASGGVPDNTNGANSYRAAWYRGPWAQKHALDGRVVGGNRFAFDPAVKNGPFAPYPASKVDADDFAARERALWKKQRPGNEKVSSLAPQASIPHLPNLVRMASAAAGSPGAAGQGRMGVDPIQLDIHHHQDGRVKSIRAKSGDGVKLNIRSSPTMVSTAVA